jgi:hypothetical protein
MEIQEFPLKIVLDAVYFCNMKAGTFNCLWNIDAARSAFTTQLTLSVGAI